MRHFLAGLTGLMVTLSLALIERDMNWRVLAAGFLLVLGIRLSIELFEIEKKRDRHKKYTDALAMQNRTGGAARGV